MTNHDTIAMSDHEKNLALTCRVHFEDVYKGSAAKSLVENEDDEGDVTLGARNMPGKGMPCIARPSSPTWYSLTRLFCAGVRRTMTMSTGPKDTMGDDFELLKKTRLERVGDEAGSFCGGLRSPSDRLVEEWKCQTRCEVFVFFPAL